MTLQEKFTYLKKKGMAVLATNFYNYETLEAVLLAASETGSPVILQTSPGTIDYLGIGMAATMARKGLEKHQVEGWLHLDHATSIELIKQCLDSGYNSVMIDASEKSFSDNVEITSRVTELASGYGASVEAELGYVAKQGQAQNLNGFTSPDEARIFVEQTGIDALAVAIGSAHGFYTKEPNLDLALLEQISHATGCPLVLHGSSGIPEDQLQEAIRRGIRKINLATELKNIFMKTLQSCLRNNEEIDLRKMFPTAINETSDLVKSKLRFINEVKSANQNAFY